MSAKLGSDLADPQEQRIAQLLRSHLDDSLEDYDAATLSRLNQARQKALDELPASRLRRWYGPGLGLAAAAALVMMISIEREPPAVSESAPTPALVSTQLSVDELALLASEDDMELFEDLEFYAWLEQQQDWDGSSS